MSIHYIKELYIQILYNLKRKGGGRRKQLVNKVEFRGNFEAYVFQKNKKYPDTSCFQLKNILNYRDLFIITLSNYKKDGFFAKTGKSMKVIVVCK